MRVMDIFELGRNVNGDCGCGSWGNASNRSNWHNTGNFPGRGNGTTPNSWTNQSSPVGWLRWVRRCI